MAKAVGLSFNRVCLLGRVTGDPVVNGEWVSFQFKTIVPKLGPDNKWVEAEVMVPIMSNDPRKVETVTNFVQDERQLYIEGYVEAWDGGCGVFIGMIKLGSKTMYDADAQQGGYQGGGQKKGNFPS